jgi:TatD DNase family protein
MSFYTVDFGINLASQKYYSDEDVEEIMVESYKNGVGSIVSISNNIKESERNIMLSKTYEHLYYTIGVHPHNAKNFKKTDIEFLEANINGPKCFGLGECGLDYNRMFSSKESQQYAFRQQIELAKKYDKKMYLHCRDAYEDFINVLTEYGYYKGLVHTFSGNISQALELTGLGFKLGITGMLLDKRRNKDLVKVIQDPRIKLEHLIVETDAPFMPIYDTKKSSPIDTGEIVRRINDIKDLEFVRTGKILYKNSVNFLL